MGEQAPDAQALGESLGRLAAERAQVATVYAVTYSNYEPAEVDSLWFRPVDAQQRADELGGMWGVTPWQVQ